MPQLWLNASIVSARGHVQPVTMVEVHSKEVDLGVDPHNLKNVQNILVVDGSLCGDWLTPGELICPNVVVAREKQEV